MDAGEIARMLAVARKSVNAWKRAWRAGGIDALVVTGYYPWPTSTK